MFNIERNKSLGIIKEVGKTMGKFVYGASLVVSTNTSPVVHASQIVDTFVPNEPNYQGDYATTVKPGDCAPYERPYWSDRSISYRCLEPNERNVFRIDITELMGGSLIVTPSDNRERFLVRPGQSRSYSQNALCTLEISYQSSQPQVTQNCVR